MARSCIVCGEVNGACGPHQPLIFPPITAPNERGKTTMATTEGPIYLARQHVKAGRGKPGYKGKNIKVVDDPAAARAADAKKASKDSE